MAGQSPFGFGARGYKLEIIACRVLFKDLPERLAAVSSTLLASPYLLPWECRKSRLESEELVDLLLDKFDERMQRLLWLLFIVLSFFSASLHFLSTLSRHPCTCAPESQESPESRRLRAGAFPWRSI